MDLEDKVALIHGGGGAIGSAVARAMARDGARVVLAGRSRARLEAAAALLAEDGARAEVAVLDALDEHHVEEVTAAVASRHGRLDITLNAVGFAHVQGTPLLELGYEEYARPLYAYTRCNFLTARAAARHMVARADGVIFTLSTPGSRMAAGGFMGYGAACAAIEAMTRHLAGELGPQGVRAICLRSDAIPQAMDRGSHTAELFERVALRDGRDARSLLAERARTATLLGRLPELDDLAGLAATLAGRRGAAVTAAVINLTCGSVVDV